MGVVFVLSPDLWPGRVTWWLESVWKNAEVTTLGPPYFLRISSCLKLPLLLDLCLNGPVVFFHLLVEQPIICPWPYCLLTFYLLSTSYNICCASSLLPFYHLTILSVTLCILLPSRCRVQYCKSSNHFLALCIFFLSLTPSLPPSPSNSWPCSVPVLHARLPHRNVMFVHKHDKKIDKNVSAQRPISDQ